ncbi:MAG: glycosyltransferase, partial [Gemmatimonadales bacterium]
MSDPLTILHLTHEGRGAGSSISIALLAREQAAAGHRVLVGCPDRTYLAGLVRGSGAELVPMAFAPGDASGAEVEQLVREARVDVVNAHSSRDRAACRRLRLAGRLPGALVMTRRGMPMSTPISAVLSGFAADRTIAVSRPVARSLVRRGTPPWRVRVVHNAVDLARIDRAVTDQEAERVRALIAADGRPVVGVVARRKDHDTLLRAMHFLTTPATLCIV